MLDRTDLLARRLAAESILREAGKKALRRFGERDFEVESKSRQDFVTEVDRSTEALILGRLNDLFAQDGFMGEEGGRAVGDAVWIIDPIDGTSNFVRGVPFWCLSAGLVIGTRPVVGVIYDPCRDEIFSAHAGGGAFLNGEPMKVSTMSEPSRSIIAVGHNSATSTALHVSVLAALLDRGFVYRMPGAGALALAHVAAGRFDGYWEAIIHPWDVAAGLALISEAGGHTSNFFAQGIVDRPGPVMACSPGVRSPMEAACLQAFEAI